MCGQLGWARVGQSEEEGLSEPVMIVLTIGTRWSSGEQTARTE
jgi:hypothetical protein